MYKMESLPLCLVSFSVKRGLGKHTAEEQEILTRLKGYFNPINGPVDGLVGHYELTREFYEVETYLRTSLGLLDFVDLPLEDSLWITQMYLEHKLDILVHYVEEDYGGDRNYQPHTNFPVWDNIVTKEVHLGERVQQYREGLSTLTQNEAYIE